jgi:hypothetical protein
MMKVNLAKLVVWSLIVGLSPTLLGCGSSNRLKDYTFRELTAAAVMDAPRPEVFTASFIDIDADDLFASVLHAGTALVKEITAGQAQARLDSAMIQVDVPRRVQERTLQRCSEYLHLWPVHDADGSDFLFDMYIESYGIDAESWDAGVSFQIDLKVSLLDNSTGLEIWKTRVKEKQLLSRSHFYIDSYAAGNVITAIALSQLSTEDMAAGFQQLAEDTADRLARKLRQDYARSREKE